MKRLLTLMTTTALASAPALAHPGHDHSGAPGGEQHHLLWVGLAALVVAAAAVAAVARRKRR